jgi:prephenate dehydrogenase
MTTHILILGLNRTSTSLGMVMKKSADLIERAGFDPDPSAIKKALHLGAMDRTVESLNTGCKDADIILYSLPEGQMLEVIKAIRQDIKPGCVFIDTNPIGHDTFMQVSQVLPDPNAFIAWVPAFNPKYMLEQDAGPASAQEDLFLNSHVYIAGNTNTRPVALNAGGDLAILARALPLFIEPDELAGILALSHDFPRLMATVITRLTTSEPGWNEARKLAGYDFDSLSAPLTSFEDQGTPEIHLHANRKNLQRLIVLMIQELQQIHEYLDDDMHQELGKLVKNTILARQIWTKQRMDMSWLEKQPVNPDEPHSITELMFGKRRKKTDSK